MIIIKLIYAISMLTVFLLIIGNQKYNALFLVLLIFLPVVNTVTAIVLILSKLTVNIKN